MPNLLPFAYNSPHQKKPRDRNYTGLKTTEPSKNGFPGRLRLRVQASVSGLCRFSKQTPSARLPGDARMTVQGSQPPVAPTGGINANGKAKVEDFGISLLRMSHDDCATRLMRTHLFRFKQRPTQLMLVSLADRVVGKVIGVR